MFDGSHVSNKSTMGPDSVQISVWQYVCHPIHFSIFLLHLACSKFPSELEQLTEWAIVPFASLGLSNQGYCNLC